jgi:hypothetical protein
MQRTIEQRLQIIEDCEEIIKLQSRYVNLNDGGGMDPLTATPRLLRICSWRMGCGKARRPVGAPAGGRQL